MRGEIFFESFWNVVIVNMMGEEIFMVAMIFFVLRCAIETVTGSFFRYRTGFLWV